MFLTVLFLINGEWSFVPGYAPILQPDLATCQTRIDFAIDYFSRMADVPEHVIDCIEAENAPQAIVELYQRLTAETED